MKKNYEFNKKWLDELLKDKNNTNARYELSDNDTRILLTYVEILQNRIDKAIKYYESNQQECVIGRNKDDKLIKEYYLPAQCSKKMLDILKESGE